MPVSDEISILEVENRALKKRIRELESSIETSNFWYEKIIDSIPNPIFVKNEEHQWVLFNTAFCTFIGKTKEELIGKSDFDFFEKEQAEVFWKKDSEVLLNNVINWNEEDITTKGEIRKLLTAKTRISDDTGNHFILGVITDISDNKNNQILLQKKNQEISEQKRHIETLLKEVHHRVKNNLQIVKSLLRFQMNQFENEELKTAFQDNCNRVVSMAKVHETLYKTTNFSTLNLHNYLHDLVSTLTQLFPEEQKRNIHLEVDHVFVESDLAMSIGLIVNETITNSIKHFGEQEHNLDIYLNFQTTDGKGILKIGDNGPGKRIEHNQNSSLGLELISMLSEQIGATLHSPTEKKGTHYHLEFPLTDRQ